jgi:hypothetical protein
LLEVERVQAMTEIKSIPEENAADALSSAVVVTRFNDLGKGIIKAAAIVTAMISVAVPLTEYVRGYSNQKISEAERNSKLASEFLDKIAAKDVSSPDRLMYLGALAKLKDHPLQAWAEEQRAILEKEIADMKLILSKAQQAHEGASVANTKIATLQVQIDMAELGIQQAQSKSQIEAEQSKVEGLRVEMAKAKADLAQQEQVLKQQVVQIKNLEATTSMNSDQLMQMIMMMMMQQKTTAPPAPAPPVPAPVEAPTPAPGAGNSR